MKKIYIYPNILYQRKDIDTNPYMWNLFHSISGHFELLQTNRKPSASLFFDLFKYIPKADYIYFNWIEEIALGKFGPVKFILYFFMIWLVRIKKIRIIYLLHNKKPHQSNKLSVLLLHDIIKRADILLTHSKEGLEYIRTISPSKQAYFIPHPFEEIRMPENGVKDIDILIWGTIKPYKGILEFIKNLEINNLSNKYRIKIVGKISDPAYRENLLVHRSENIHIENQPIESDSLGKIISRAKVVLFTYKNDTVLSSGALMMTLSFGATVIGPSAGAFNDLYHSGLAYVYEDFESMIRMIDEVLSGKAVIDRKKIQTYIAENTWASYSATLKKIIENHPGN